MVEFYKGIEEEDDPWADIGEPKPTIPDMDPNRWRGPSPTPDDMGVPSWYSNWNWDPMSWMTAGGYQKFPEAQIPWWRHPSWGFHTVYNPQVGWQRYEDVKKFHEQEGWDPTYQQFQAQNWSQRLDPANMQGWQQYWPEAQTWDTWQGDTSTRGTGWANDPWAPGGVGVGDMGQWDIPYTGYTPDPWNMNMGQIGDFPMPQEWGTASNVLSQFAEGMPTTLPDIWRFMEYGGGPQGTVQPRAPYPSPYNQWMPPQQTQVPQKPGAPTLPTQPPPGAGPGSWNIGTQTGPEAPQPQWVPEGLSIPLGGADLPTGPKTQVTQPPTQTQQPQQLQQPQAPQSQPQQPTAPVQYGGPIAQPTPGGFGGLRGIAQTGMPTPQDPWYQQAKGVAQTDIEDAIFQAGEQMGMQGLRWSTPLARQAQEIAGETMAKTGLEWTGRELDAAEAARGRIMQTLPLMQQLGTGQAALSEAAKGRGIQAAGMLPGLGQMMQRAPMDWAKEMMAMSAPYQGMRQAEISPVWQEAMRMAPELSPWLQMAMQATNILGPQQQWSMQQYAPGAGQQIGSSIMSLLPLLGLL